MKNQVIIIGLLSLIPGITHAERSITFGIESFEWQEPIFPLTESGNRYSIGITSGNLLSSTKGYLHEYSASIYEGTIDYDGGIQNNDGTSSRLKAETKYSGLKGEAKLAYREGKFDYVGAIGIDKWSRDIGNSKIESGYEEIFTQPYIKLGIGYLHRTGAAIGRFEAGFKHPFNVTEEISRFDTELEPKSTDSVYIQYRYQSNRKWGVTVYSEKTHFEKSDAVNGIHQPESKADALGAKIHYSF